jgi:hypothetical protein|tara:strand:- start:1042 stop:1389 length:348 start_codon:yes stop_codon:yes gene_type:complete
MTIDKSLYEAPDGKKKKILIASESPAEEADLEFDSLLKQYQEWKKHNKGTFQDFLKSDDPVIPIKLKKGGFLSRELLVSMLKNEYPKEYNRINTDDYSDKQLQELLNNLDAGVPF